MRKAMNLTLAALLAAASATVILPSTAMADPINPSNCNCVWMATGYNESTGEFIYGWVCPNNPVCVDEKVPEG